MSQLVEAQGGRWMSFPGQPPAPYAPLTDSRLNQPPVPPPELPDEVRKRIEANKQAALARKAANEKMREEEKQNFLQQFH